MTFLQNRTSYCLSAKDNVIFPSPYTVLAYNPKFHEKPYKAVAGVVELADALDSKSSGSDTVWVQLPPPAPKPL